MSDKPRPSVKNSKKMPSRRNGDQRDREAVPEKDAAPDRAPAKREAADAAPRVPRNGGDADATVAMPPRRDISPSAQPAPRNQAPARPQPAGGASAAGASAVGAPAPGANRPAGSAPGSAPQNASIPTRDTYRPTVMPASNTRAARRFAKDYDRAGKRSRKRRREVDIPTSKGDARAMVPATTYKRRVSIPQRIARVVGVIAAIVLMAVVVLVGALSVTEYRPADTEEVAISHTGINVAKEGQQMSIVTWNLGYCGLSSEADFFMDGGKGVRTVSEEGVNSNLGNIESELAQLDPDVMFLQEVDVDSRRSYHVNESSSIAQNFQNAGYCSAFATNYLSMFVPYPFPPIGQVDSGIQTESRFGTDEAERIQLPCPFDWPVRLGNLKRCLLVERVPIEDSDKDLVLVNLHLEAYDDGEGKAEQTAQLVKLMQREYEKGNYVIAGGDFNQTFSNIDTSAYPQQPGDLWQCGQIDASSFDDGWQLLMDTSVPTCRSLDRPYDASDSSFQYYMIDGFICSPNVQVDETATVDTGFAYSDHNPVKLTVTLKGDE